MSTRTWVPGDPAGSDAANTIDNAIQRARQDILERLMQGGHKFAGTTPPAPNVNENADGRLCVGYETQTFQTDAGYLTLAWRFDGTTAMIRQYGHTHATQADQTEIPGDLVGPSAVAITKGGKAVGAFTRVVTGDTLPVASSYLKRVIYKVPSFTGAPGRTLQRLMVIVGAKPVGADLVVTVRKLAAPAVGTDRFIDGSSTQIATTTLTVASGNFAVEATALAQALATDDELVVKYGTVGSTTAATDLSIILQIE
jgi:hypothetical protein